ncbi:MAG: class I SAM-dependent methyltransferase [Candidatus Thorarchaeota archaeon]|nr:class I SAM-dependent methyltransferase [Candidatus Thorarchaeota archaeon]
MTSFDELAIAYDRAINWTQRLDREIPFILSHLSKTRPRRILDLACGSGQHLIALASHGCTGIGVDNSMAMIQIARELAEEKHANVQFLFGDIQEVSQMVEGPFDLVLCVGNSLALLPGHDIIAETVRAVRELLTEQGKLIIQVLNFEEIRETGFRFFPLKEGHLRDGRRVVFGRFFDHDSNLARSTLVMSSLIEQNGEWDATVATQQVVNLDKGILQRILLGEGFQTIELFSGYNRKPFDPHANRNIVAVASK